MKSISQKVVAFLTIVSFFIGIPTNFAFAAANVTSATLNGGGNVIVAPGASINAVVNVTTTGSGNDNDWESTSWRISTTGGSGTCVNTDDHNGTASYSENFSITAPTTPGTYNVYFTAYNFGSCFSGGSSLTMTGVVVVTKHNTVTTITSDTPDPSLVGQSYTVGVSVTRTSGSVTPSGTVTISDGTDSCQDTTASGSGATVTYSCNLVSTTDGEKTLTATYAGDSNFNSSVSVGASHTVNLADTTAPTVILTSTASSLTNDSPIPVTATFSETVTGFTAGDVTVTNGTVGNFAGAGAVYTFDVTPSAPELLVTTRVLAGVAEDAATNDNEISNLLSHTYNPNVFDTGLVTFSFDDGYKSAFNNIGLLGSFKSTQYVNTVPMLGADSCGGISDPNCYGNYITSANVVALRTAGHEIADHTRSHPDLVPLSAIERQFEIDGDRLDLIQGIGIPVSSLAYPFGSFDETVKSALKAAGISGARSVFPDQFNDKTTDRYALFARQVNSDVTLVEVQGWIDDAVDSKEWLVLVFHEILADCGAELYCTTPTMLGDIATYLSAQGSDVSVVTMGQGLAQMNNAPVTDGLAPVITQADISIDATSSAGVSVPFAPVVTDSDTNLPATLQAFCTIPNIVPDPISGLIFPTPVTSGVNFPIGVTTVTCTSADTGGHLGTKVFTVTVTNPDLVSPTLVLSTAAVSPTNDSPIPLTATFNESVTGFDSSDVVVTNGSVGTVSGGPSVYTFDVTPVADGPVTVNVAGNVAIDIFNNGNSGATELPVVYDNTAPVVTVTGDTVVNLFTGGSYTELGATAVDAIDPTVDVIVSGSVNTALPGVYPITYSATDDAGNIGSTVRTVNVSDASAPVFSGVPANMVLEATGPTGVVVTYTLPTATDDVDGSVVVSCDPVSGTTLSIAGSPHTVSCSAQDVAGNIGSASFTVTVEDTTKPVLTAPADQQFEATGPMTTPVLVPATASDAADLSPVVSYDVHDFALGTHVVTWSALDVNGNSADTVTSNVTIVDTTDPVVTVDSVATVLNIVPAITFSVTDAVTAIPTTECQVDGGVIVPCTSPFDSGIVETVGNTTDGLHTVSVRATDGAGNVSSFFDISFTLDTVHPTADVSYSNTAPTNLDVIATLINESEPITVTSVGGAAHTFALNGLHLFQFVDAAGNTGDLQAGVTNIDKDAPVVSIDIFPAVNIANQSAVTVSGLCSEEGVTVSLSVASLNASPICTVGAWEHTFDFSGVSDGALTLEASQTDAVGNTTTVDEGSVKDVVSPTATVSYSDILPTNDDVITTLVPSEAVVVTNNSASMTYTFVDNGAFTFAFEDLVGNPGSAEAEVANIDNGLPSLTITSQPAAFINVATAAATFETDLDATITCVLTGVGTVDTCSATSADLSGLAEGAHTLTITATDPVGNEKSEPLNFIVDLNAPAILFGAITGLPTTPSIAFSTVDANAVTTECALNLGAFSTCVSPFAPAALDGDHTVTVRATDAAGNIADATSTIFTVDLPPTISYPTGTQNMAVAYGTTFEVPGVTANDVVDGEVAVATTSILFTNLLVTDEATTTVNTNATGTYKILYTATDTAGNSTSSVRTIVVSDLALSTEQSANISQNSITINWTTSHPATSRVVWGTTSVTNASSSEAGLNGDSNYGYPNTTATDTTMVLNHSVVVSGLSANTTYFFRPVSHGSPETTGNEVTAQTSAAPVVSSGGGGGGGGGGFSYIGDVRINNGANQSSTTNVTLNLYGSGLQQMQISNTGTFSGIWMPFQTPFAWTLTPGDGTKTVYVRFGSASTTMTGASDTIILVGSGTTSTPATTGGTVLGATTQSCYAFTKNLGLGSTGGDVTALQTRLTADGLYSGPITGYFGPMTMGAVKAFQAKNGLEAVGIVGPKTRAALNTCGTIVAKAPETTGAVLGTSTFVFTKTLALGSTGEEVTALQTRLTAEGVYTGPITGYFGPMTMAGVQAYQSAHGLDPVGIVGPKTRAELNK